MAVSGQGSSAWCVVALVILVILATVPFAGSLKDGFLNWDDNFYIYDNPLVTGFGWRAAGQILSRPHYTDYSPVFLMWLGVQYRVVGGHALGFRLVSLALHAVGVVLVFVFVKRTMRRPAVAFLAAALFAVHPVQVESVAWVTEQKNLLSPVFLMLCLLANARASAHEARRGRWRWYAASVVLAILALFTKPSTVVLPVLIGLYCVCFLKWSVRRVGLWAVPFAVISVVATVLAVFAQGRANAIASWHGGNILTHVLTMLTVWPKYLRLVVLPLHMTPYRPKVLHTSIVDVSVLAGVGLLVTVVITCLVAWRRSGRMFFWLLWVPVCFAPVANIIPMRILMAERYMHLPMVGMATLAASLVFWISDRMTIACVRRAFFSGVLTVIVLCCMVSYAYSRIYGESLALWRRALTCAPGQAVPLLNLGAAYAAGSPPSAQQALRAFKKVDFGPAPDRRDLVMLYFNLGNIYRHIGRPELAVDYLETLAEWMPEDPSRWFHLSAAYNEMRIMPSVSGHERARLMAEEERALRRTLALDPGHLQARNNLGTLLMDTGRSAEAEEHLQQAVLMAPDSPFAYYNLGLLYMRMGKLTEARDSFRECFARATPEFPKAREVQQYLTQIERQLAQ